MLSRIKYNSYMKAIITNKLILLQNPSLVVRRSLEQLLSFKDKSKLYQLNRMAKNPFLKKTQQYKDLEKEANGKMWKEVPGGHMVFSSGLFHYIERSGIPFEDRRTDTGDTISLPWKNKAFDPRDYQREAIDIMKNHYRGVVNLATGMGKSLIALYAIKEIKKKTLIVVPGESIAKQFIESLQEAFGEHKVALYGSGKKKIADITVGIAASIVRNLDEFKEENLGLIIFDEVHHIAANTFYDIASALGDTGKIFGLTATDYRSDGKDIMITAGCGDVKIKRDIKWGVEHKYLAKPVFISKNIDTRGGDFKDNKLKNYKANVLNDPYMNKQIIEDITNYRDQGLNVLCLVAEVAHGEALAKKIGCPFAQGKDSKSQSYVKDLNEGRINCLIGTGGKVGEGTDTRRVDVLIMANFMASKGPVIQAIGRGLRIYGDKTECIIIDYVPNGSSMLKRHALQRIEYFKEIVDEVIVS